MNKPIRFDRQGSHLSVLLVLVLTVLSVGCRDNALNDLSPEDSQVFITNYDRSIDFSQYRTFSLPDSVVVESNNEYGTSRTALEVRFVDKLAAALTSRGYQRVSGQGTNADLGVALIRINNRYTGVSTPYSPYYLNYWYGPGFGYGPGYYDPFYPYYPGYYSFYQVSERFWQIQIVDLKNSPAPGSSGSNQNQLNVIFQADIRGDDVFNDATVDRAIDAIFSQSPYLQTSL